ncbi:fatty acid desaturase family protein [Phaeocystidibacter luteus]|uniref:Acyl-CoA desaturase n=1 Tax=Phaeocystidibacter luteus TaxID=911197 RepID=A0A6N6RGX6_9FLAO|nr:acyl-CoA desaturase [Phaeocystidibacter luteus]KAB2813616.1 acyl-CoA desaturase [Phaeocystidibacter luteus]
MSTMKDLRVDTERNKAFAQDLNRRVHAYLNQDGKSPYADFRYYLKAVFMAGLYWVPFFLMLFHVGGTPLFWISWILMGFGMSGIGMNVMHDANHGSVSTKQRINKFFGASMYLLSGYVLTWQIQHNHLHHNYTNHIGQDEDLETRGLLRLHPGDKWKKGHKFQAWYGPFIYGLLTLNWVLVKDFSQVARYNKMGLLEKFKTTVNKEFVKLSFIKALYIGVFLGLPMMMGWAWYSVLLGFVIMHFLAGFVLSFVFQLAHVVPEVDHPTGEEIKGPGAWQVNQLLTTSNFAMKNPVLTWSLGGLNHQIEHHLFPHVSHVHYPALAKIVERTAKEHGLPYFKHSFMLEAVAAHLRFLNDMGKKPATA